MSIQNTFNKTSGKGDDIDKEVNHLIKKHMDRSKSTYAIAEDLKGKYKDKQMVESILNKYKEKLNRVKKIAEKIRDRLLIKYPSLSMKEYYNKVYDYKRKYKFDDAEMKAILNLLFTRTDNVYQGDGIDNNYNEMSKALGFVPASFNYGKIEYNGNDETEALQGILTIAGATAELHSQVTLQSLIYEDINDEAINGEFDKTKINIFSYVHPVIAALFLPKIKFIDEHMLIASIANIVQQRYNGLELTTQPDYELYMDIATDPNETACTFGKPKPFADLLTRCNVQTKLWEAVLNLRQGKYYTNDLTSFILAIDNCKNSIFDAADLAYVKDEGTILRKLLSAFSIRPTIVTTAPVYGISYMSNVANLSVTHITTIAMVTMRIPPNIKKETDSVSLKDALDQKQLYIHRKQFTVKSQQIMYSREVLIFYVHRRFQMTNLNRLVKPYQMAILPVTMNAHEQLLDTPVNFNFGITLESSKQTFTLKSIVAVQTAPNNPNLIIGCNAIIRTSCENINGAVIYSPLILKNDNNDKKSMNEINPISWTTDVNNNMNNKDSVQKIGQTKGTLFIYVTEQDSNMSLSS